MDGVARPAGSGVPILWKNAEGNEEWLVLEPLGLKEIGELEQYMLSLKPNPIELAKKHMDGLPEHLQEKLLLEAYRDARKANKIPPEETAEFMDSSDGMAFTFWLVFEKRYPGRFKKEEVFDIVAGLGPEDFKHYRDLRDQASGLDEQGNSTGPPEEPRPEGKRRRRRRR